MHRDWLSLCSVMVALVPALLFSLFYGLRSRWYSNYVGWWLMNQSGTMAVSLIYVLVVNLWPGVPFHDLLRFVVFLLIAISLWAQFLVLLKAQRAKPQNINYGRRATDVVRKDPQDDESSTASR